MCNAEWELCIQLTKLMKNVQEMCPYFSNKYMDTIDQNLMEI